MTHRICSINDCDRPAMARDMCSPHYARWQKWGDASRGGPVKARRKVRPQVCAVEDCASPQFGRSWCSGHYSAWQRYGDPLGRAVIASADERFWAKVSKTDSCWGWTAATNQYGYPVFRGSDGKNYLAHRYSYSLEHGALPDGMQLDHRCHNTLCVNPSHLRPVTNKQNQENLSGPRSAASGVRGVYLDKRVNRWYGQVVHNGTCYGVGSFVELVDAEAAVIAKRNELFTHNDRDRS